MASVAGRIARGLAAPIVPHSVCFFVVVAVAAVVVAIAALAVGV